MMAAPVLLLLLVSRSSQKQPWLQQSQLRQLLVLLNPKSLEEIDLVVLYAFAAAAADDGQRRLV